MIDGEHYRLRYLIYDSEQHVPDLALFTFHRQLEGKRIEMSDFNFFSGTASPLSKMCSKALR